MSIFTKIFVVLVMVLSVLLVALVVPYVMNTQTYKGQLQAMEQRAIVAEHNAGLQESAESAAIAAAMQEVSQRDQQIVQLSGQINQKDTQLANLQSQLIKVQNSSDDVRSQLARLTTTAQMQAQLIDQLQTEVRDRRENMLALQTRNIELNDRVRDLSTTVDTLTSQVRLDREEYAALQQQFEDAQRTMATPGAPGGTSAPGITAGPGPQPSVAIRGLVTDVRRVGDETLVALNVGRNDGVQQGMSFMVHRGNQYLGDAVVTTVDAGSAAARVVRQRGEITPNAEVLAGGL